MWTDGAKAPLTRPSPIRVKSGPKDSAGALHGERTVTFELVKAPFDTPNGQDRSSLVELQRLLLPPALPPIGCTEAAAHYRVHNDSFRIGGDWYDLIDRPDERIVAIVGDVVGHGVQQIGVMGQLRAAANALGRTLEDPGAILSALDDFARELPGAEYTSVAVMMLDGSLAAQFSTAGHPPPLHVCPNRQWSTIDVGRGPLLGVDGNRPTATFEYSPGDLFVMYTDGLTDRRNADPTQILRDVARFVGERSDRSCQEIATGVIDEHGGDVDDDVVVLALRPRDREREREGQRESQLTPSARFD